MAGQTRQPLIEPVSTAMQRGQYKGYDIMSFPENLGAHSIVLNFSKYDFGQGSSPIVDKITESSICLPLPQNITDSFNVRVVGTELGITGNAVAQGAQVLEDQLNGGAGGVSAILSSIQGSLTGMGAKALLRKALEKSDGGVIKGLEAATGYADNPHLALTFDGVDLKQHNFSWQLAPQSAYESEMLRKIIHKFKQSILPTYKPGFGKTFFNFPNVVDVFFMGTEPGYLYSFKRCMVNTFEVNYAGAGGLAFVEGGKPAVVNITANLMEMDIHTAEDYGRSDGGASGNDGFGGTTNSTGPF